MPGSPRREVKSWPADFLCSELVEVLTKSEVVVANLEAISEREAVLLCEAPMRRGRNILVKASFRVFRARVTGCRKDEIVPGYRVLIAFSGQFRWNINLYPPKHGLDMRDLVRQCELPPLGAPAGEQVFAASQSGSLRLEVQSGFTGGAVVDQLG